MAPEPKFASSALLDPISKTFIDPPGIPLVMIPWNGFEGLLKSSRAIRLYSKFDVAISLRLLRGLRDVA